MHRLNYLVICLHWLLMFVRSSVNRISGFTPFELLTGRFFPGPQHRETRNHTLSHCVYFDKLTALIKIFPAGHCGQWSQMDWTPESHLKNIALCSPSRKRRHLVSFVCLYFMWPPNRSLTQTAVDLKTQVQERVGEEPEGPPAPDVSFTKAMGKLKNLREEINAGQCYSQTDD